MNNLTLWFPLILAISTNSRGEETGIPTGATEREVPRHPEQDLQPSSIEYFKGDEQVGERRYYNNNKLFTETPMKKGLNHGLVKTWHLNGQLALAIPYENGLMHGECRHYSSEGKLLGTYKMDHGTGVEKKWTDTGVLKSETEFIAGKKDGTWKEWYGEKALEKVAHFSKGLQQGLEQIWYRNGKPMQTAFYQNDHVAGELVIWDEKGNRKIKYCLKGEYVTREVYLEKTKTDPTLPKLTEVEN